MDKIIERWSTEELAISGKVRPGSIRSSVCRSGHWMGLRPVKLPNGRLLWDKATAMRIFSGEVA
jgi:hypothetical protein